MLRYLFEVKRCHRVTIDPEVGNRRAIRCYEKAGYRFDGVLRHNAFEHGEYVDTYFMSILEHEWPAAKARWEAERGASAATTPARLRPAGGASPLRPPRGAGGRAESPRSGGS